MRYREEGKMKKRYRFCAVLLIAVLLLNGTAALADNSGTFGKLSWRLDSQGTLTVSGRGRMDGYSQPWDDLKASIRQVIIKDGVLSVGSENFSDCPNLRSVTLADSVTSIDAFAFDDCVNLKEVKFGKGLVSIGMYAFSACGLRSVSLPDSVTIIESNAFQRCPSLNSVVLPKKLSMVSKNLFQYCSSLSSIEIPDGAVLIDDDAFYDCGQLRSVTVPASVTYIGPYTFMGCDGLRDIYFKGTESQWKNLLATTDFIPSGSRDITVHYGSGGFTFTGSSDSSASSAGSGSDSSSNSFLDTLLGSGHITVSSSVSYDKGRTTVTWTDPENHGPYKVAYECADGSAQQTGFWAGGSEAESIAYGKSFTIESLIPGHSYEIRVYDSEDHVGKTNVTIPAAKSFKDNNFKASAVDVEISYRYVTEDGSQKITSVFILDQMTPYLNRSSGGCALYYQVIFPGTEETKTYLMQLAVTAPNGYAEMIVWDDAMKITKSKHGYRFWWDCIGTSYFNNLVEKNGSVPTGDYKVELFMDGMLVHAGTFKVRR